MEQVSPPIKFAHRRMTMQPSGGPSSTLPPSPLPPSPYPPTLQTQSATPNPFQPTGLASAPQGPHRKGPPKAAAAVFVIVFVVVILVFSGALDSLTNPGPSANQPNVKVTNTSASHSCPVSGVPTETFLFTLVNSGSVNAAATIGFYLNDAQVTSGTYTSLAGTSTPYSVTASLSSCPPSGST